MRTTVDPSERLSPALPEIALVGRSNVGKSSLLNALCRRRKLARTSRTPGKTQTINYYAVDEQLYLVDLPGYGYAAVPEQVRRGWVPMIERYLAENERLRGVVSLVDGRHPPTALDKEMAAWLASLRIPTLIVLTKSDRVGRGKRAERLQAAAAGLGVDDDQVVWFSARSGEGRDDVLDALRQLLDGESG